MAGEMALQRLELLSVFKTDDMIIENGAFRVDCWLLRFSLFSNLCAAHIAQRAVNQTDQAGKLCEWNRVIRDVGGNYIRCKKHDVVVGIIGHLLLRGPITPCNYSSSAAIANV